MEWRERIALDPKVLTGKPVIKGSRLAVEFIIDLLANGWTEQQIISNYSGITREDILACLAYARDVLHSPGPVGTLATDAAQQRAVRSEEYRRQRARLAPTRAIAREVILYRTENNLTQEQLADMIGSSRTQVSRIESGRHMPSLTTLQKIAEALNLKLSISLEQP